MNRKMYERLIRYVEAAREPWKDKYAARRTAMILKGSTRLTRGEKAAADAAFEEKMKKIIITRHPALVRVMVEDGIIGADVPVVAHATPEDVAGRHVFGVLPLALAAEAEKVTVPDLRVPAELRGQDLTEEQVRRFLHGWRTFEVKEVEG